MRFQSIVILGLMASLLGQPVAEAAGPPTREAIPADLAGVPPNTQGFVSLRPAAMLAGDIGRDLRQASRLNTMNLRDWADRLSLMAGGVPLAELARVALFHTPQGTAFVFTSTRSVNPDSVLAAVGIKAPQEKRHGCRFHVVSESYSLAFVSSRTFLHGPVKVLESMLAGNKEAVSEPFAAALRVADRYHIVCAGTGGGASGREGTAETLAGMPVGSVQTGRVFLNFGRDFEVSCQATFATQETAGQAKTAAEAARTLAQENLDELGEILAERFVPVGGPRLARDVLAFCRSAGPALRGLRIEQKGKTLSAEVKMSGRGALWALVMAVLPVDRLVPIGNMDQPSGRQVPPALPRCREPAITVKGKGRYGKRQGAACEHRLAETRDNSAAPLPGKSLCVFKPSCQLVTDIIPCEDGHAQERSLVDPILARIKQNSLRFEGPNPATFPETEEVLELIIHLATPNETPVLLRQLYTRRGKQISVICMTTSEAEASSVKPVFEAILRTMKPTG